MHIFTLEQRPECGDDIARLLHSEWSDLENWASVEQIGERLRQRNQPGRHSVTLVACAPDNHLMATASIIEYELNDDPRRRYWLGEVFTALNWRGRGVGSALVKACIARAKAARLGELWLYTPDQQALYQRLGWYEVEQRDIAGERVSVMVLRLDLHPEAA